MFGQVLDNDAIDAELDALVANDGPAIPNAPVNPIEPKRQKIEEKAAESSEEDEVEKRLAAAM